MATKDHQDDVELEDTAAEVEGDEWEDDEPPRRRPGPYKRAKRAVRRRFKTYLKDAVPRDDDGPEDLPRWLQGTRGRIFLALGAVGIMCLWVLLVWWFVH